MKRVKAIIINNYKTLNSQYLKFEDLIKNINKVLIDQIQDISIPSNFHCKFGFQQINLIEESKVLTAFSANTRKDASANIFGVH